MDHHSHMQRWLWACCDCIVGRCIESVYHQAVSQTRSCVWPGHCGCTLCGASWPGLLDVREHGEQIACASSHFLFNKIANANTPRPRPTLLPNPSTLFTTSGWLAGWLIALAGWLAWLSPEAPAPSRKGSHQPGIGLVIHKPSPRSNRSKHLH
jgi:hypothetical protein